ncbi:ornithine carbamoyltransferase [Neobacillus sp. OS1-32]|jgi:ornithine carbamoyltransferase|uniref:Ornithine carbamoyltransferase n=2 Tax=Bacillaceae TaxID=186817 RepID=A0ABS1THY2_9BACI|nr:MULTISPECIES: ornithine carbamoyltransferase [Neobacillus]MBL4950867.1 ornithine carbamoyltransferase [Neobacillus paridis]WML31150.1 ornithine carbamoyltransferase [Neobacillus sp. OS1-32]
MAVNLRGRHFLTLKDYTPEEIEFLINQAIEFKRLKYAGVPHKMLKGKNIALLFEKPSTRTRCAFTVACIDLGAHPEYLGKGDIQFGKKESNRDTAIVLGRMFDGIEFRGFKHETVEDLAKYSGVPVWNGLTDLFHPTQILADFMTIKEKLGYLKGIKFAYIGDARNNMGNSLMIGSAKMGMDFRAVAPKELHPAGELVEYAQGVAKDTGAKITITDSIEDGVKDVDVIYTDVWVSMGEEDKFEERINLLKKYQVNKQMMAKTGKEHTLFMHCLPAFHDLETEVGRDIHQKFGLDAMEVTDEVFRSKNSVVFDEAENRMHTIKAVMAATLS